MNFPDLIRAYFLKEYFELTNNQAGTLNTIDTQNGGQIENEIKYTFVAKGQNV
jgi:hypothetical protein